MKLVLIISTIIVCFESLGQSGFIAAHYDYNLDLWKPYSKAAEDYIAERDNVTSNTWGSNLLCRIYSTEKVRFYIGLSYKKINHQITDRIEHWNYIESHELQGEPVYDTIYYTFNDPADLIAKSNNFGGILSFNYSLNSGEKVNSSLGLNTSIFFLEYYKSWYSTSDLNAPKIYPNNPPLKHFFFSSMNVSLFYLCTYQILPSISLGAKISLGTNLYSDWDQFKRYAWLGVGLELGFGKSVMDKNRTVPADN